MPELSDVHAFLAQLRQEFIDASLDRLNDIEALIETMKGGRGRESDAMTELRRHVHSMKGSAGTHGLHVVSQIAHRVEDYFETVDAIGPRQLSDILVYLDRIREILEDGKDPDAETAAEIFRRLPAPLSGESADEVDRTLHALLVMPKSVQRKIIAQELLARGLQVSMVDTGLAALRAALTERPDMVIASQEIEDFSGAELARVCAVIRATARCRFILVTSHDAGDPTLARMPEAAAVIRKGRTFSADLDRQLGAWGM